MKLEFRVGQRWLSVSEPELGLGEVSAWGDGRVSVRFAAAGEVRQYVAESAPLRRLTLKAGERARLRSGAEWTVQRVEIRAGLLVYRGEGGECAAETELDDRVSAGGAEARLRAGLSDSSREFDLRRESLTHQHQRRRSAVRGFMGGRMDLIPHQLYIAQEVTSRPRPRVLLADEVGLGKTVEACLIVHRLLATGRAARVLVVVPEPLVHQWFVELLRRFNLWFHLFDEERCDAIEGGEPATNPFLEDQLVLCALPLLRDPRRGPQAVAAGWDVLVVDEAHHLAWEPGQPGADYLAIEALAKSAEGVLLLTATPEQLGVASHFARLRLLDPHRFHDLAAFERESGLYVRLAGLASRLLGGEPLEARDGGLLEEVLGAEPESVRQRVEALAGLGTNARDGLVQDLLDRHGTGRVMFRNTRSTIRGFPRRRPQPAPLPPGTEAQLERLATEFDTDQTPSAGVTPPTTAGRTALDLEGDPRIEWLAGLFRELSDAKVLLICRSVGKVLGIEAALRARLAVKVALFHEGLELVQRDRNAAWFADPEGARIMIASEIGSEGRNFQFAHHLVLFDLPLDPELIEQRIGRLDRIGQTSEIQIHVPYVRDSAQEVVFRWYHEGCDAFGRSSVAGRALRERFAAAVRDLAVDFHETHTTRREELNELVRATIAFRLELESQLEHGRDRLLEMNSFRAPAAKHLVETIASADQDPDLERFLLRIWDQYGVPVEDLAPRLYRLGGDGVYAGEFPGVPPEGVIATFDRRSALAREDMTFLSWDHPMVTGALDLLLGTGLGTTACVSWPRAGVRGFWLETVHVLEPTAPPKLHVDRFLPTTPLRGVIDARGVEVPERQVAQLARATLADVPIHQILEAPGMADVVESLLQRAQSRAEDLGGVVRQEARDAMDRELSHEIERLRALARVNPTVSESEVRWLEDQRAALAGHMAEARVRLESVRLILLGGA